MLTIDVFKKERMTKEGRKFNAYLTKIKNKATGETVNAGVKFEDKVDPPKDCPIRIDVTEGSVSTKKYEDTKTGESKLSYTVWVKSWEKSTDEFVDNSMDDWT